MGDYILMEGDQAFFDQTFGDAVVVVLPGTMIATGPTTINGKKICVQGDESKVMVLGCSYSVTGFMGGVGTLKIAGVPNGHVAEKTSVGGKKVLMVGGKFDAAFEVTILAKDSKGVPHGKTSFTGTGHFETTNRLFTGT